MTTMIEQNLVVPETKPWRPVCAKCKRETIKWIEPKTKEKGFFRCSTCRTLWDGSELTPAEAAERDATTARRAGKIVRALSFRQPWAWIVVYLNKDLENRSKHMHTREPFFIHASKEMTKSYYYDAIDFSKKQGANTDLIPSYEKMKETLCGGIVGSTRIIDVIPKTPQPTRKWHMVNQWGHILADTKPIEFYPCGGNQGFWEAEHICDALTQREERRQKQNGEN